MKRSVTIFLLALVTYYVLNQNVPINGTVLFESILFSFIIATQYSIYRLLVPLNKWKSSDVFLLFIWMLSFVAIAFRIGNISTLSIQAFYSGISSFFILHVIFYIFRFKKVDSIRVNKIALNRNILTLSILISSLVIPISLLYDVRDAPVNSNAVLEDIDIDAKRVKLIAMYLEPKYSNIFSEFDDLKIEDKLKFFQQIEKIESELSNRPMAILLFEPLDQNTLASYFPYKNQIILNSNRIPNKLLQEWISNILHETRHAYQFHLINQIDWNNPMIQTSEHFQDLKKIRNNLLMYTNSDYDYFQYIEQPIEMDARTFAENTLPFYQKFIYKTQDE